MIFASLSFSLSLSLCILHYNNIVQDLICLQYQANKNSSLKTCHALLPAKAQLMISGNKKKVERTVAVPGATAETTLKTRR